MVFAEDIEFLKNHWGSRFPLSIMSQILNEVLNANERYAASFGA